MDLFKNKNKKKGSKIHSEPATRKLNKGTLRAHLSKRYKGQVAERIIQILELGPKPLDLEEYVVFFENLINFQQEKLLRISFCIFDFDEDGKIDELDLFALTRIYDEFGYDLMSLSKQRG